MGRYARSGDPNVENLKKEGGSRNRERFGTWEAHSMTGEIKRHGPHQSATNSTRTGTSDFSTTSGNSAWLMAATPHRTNSLCVAREPRPLPAGEVRNPRSCLPALRSGEPIELPARTNAAAEGAADDRAAAEVNLREDFAGQQ